ncbi:sigma-70 family RNA polymerase sigma factor [Streptomyces sp. NPDC005962]|uniref:RNA polymerase sigma factor n=1 Tax=Streptomyces sp. NPDC005962 TaxID=3154466 RepID=UPI0033E4C9D9
MAEPEATPETLGRVFAQCQGEMTGKARQLLQDANVPPSVADADDIVSSAFATALRAPGAVRQPRAYLYKLIRTEIVHLATRRAEHQRLDEKRAADPLCCYIPDVADFSALVDNREAVHRAVRGLSVPQRTAVWATHALGYTRDETAVLMGKHPGTVARHSTRAIVLLRASIAAVVVGVLTALGLATGGELQRTTPADAPRRDPALPSAQWWSENWMVTAVTLTVGACVVWLLRRRSHQLARRLVDALYALMQLSGRRGLALRQRISDVQARNGRRSPHVARLCPACHRRMDTAGLTQDEQNALLRQTAFTPQARHTASACQVCGHGDSLAWPVEAAHIMGGVHRMTADKDRVDPDGRGAVSLATTYLRSMDSQPEALRPDPRAPSRK